MKRCIYCKTGIENSSVVDICVRCGVSVWGPKMFHAIIQNMRNARDVGDLYQGSVSENLTQSSKPKKSALSSIAEEALVQQEANPVEKQLDSYKPLKSSKEDIPPLVEVEAFAEPETLGPEAEMTIAPPIIEHPQSAEEDVSFLVDNL